MLIQLRAALSIAFLILALPAAATDFETQVTAEFYEDEIRFSGEFGTVYVYRWTILPSQDRVALCGVGFFRDAGFRSTIRGMARDAELYVNGSPVAVDVSYFNRVNGGVQALDTATARCRVLEMPIAGIRRIGLRFGSGVYRN